ncbi:sensor histidine kinase [Paenibacillus sp. MSJ-34]|uniref:cache domain-containing sensor histidine kinase n=1 Tax=Paenibacillus sp. MSJ-34 TaxID=2841529 RepID=UPI0034616030
MMNLRKKLFIAFIALIIIPLFSLGTATFYISTYLIEKQYKQQSELTLKAVSQNIQFIFKEMNKVTDNGIVNSFFQSALNAKDPKKQNITDLDRLNMNETQRNFRNLLYNHPSISYAFLYNFNQYAFSNSNIVSIFTKENFKALPFEEFNNHPMYRETMERNGSPLWIGPNEFPELTGTEPVFTQIRVVKDLWTLKNMGILVVQIKNWELEKIFNSFRYNDNLKQIRFFLVNKHGLILYDSSQQDDGQYLQKYIPANLNLAPGYQSYRGNFNNSESVISVNEMPDLDWYLVSVTSWKSLSEDITLFIKWIGTITTVSLLAAFLFFLLFMNRITRSIIRIVRFMRRVETGDLQVRVNEKGNDELHLLAKGFNSLIDRVNQLLEQVKLEQNHKNKAEMRVLQAQIKPHFLFNTLESINVLAIQNKGRIVSQMVHRLGNILRISIQDKEEITIKQEIEHLRSYLEIQKFRFEDLFDYEISIPDEVMRCTILKLTLQPLVENCIQHGFEGIQYKGFIHIKGRLDGNKVVIFVEDNGIGISGEQLKNFRYLQSDDPSKDAPAEANVERRGLGVRSVADRIRIQYGPGYGLFICSEVNQGTIIQCIIPRYGLGDINESESDVGRR